MCGLGLGGAAIVLSIPGSPACPPHRHPLPCLLPCPALQAVGATPESVLMLDSPQAGKDGTDEGAGSGALFLQVGLVNGVLLRTEVDRATGQLR